MANIITGFRGLISMVLLFCPVFSPVFYKSKEFFNEVMINREKRVLEIIKAEIVSA